MEFKEINDYGSYDYFVHLSCINAPLSLLHQEILSEKNMAETVVLQIPEALYQRLAIAAGATQRSLEDIILQALQIGSPPTWKDVPEEFQTDLASLDRLDDDSLWQIARSQKTQLEMEPYESLLSKQQNTALTDSERLELDNLRKDSDRFMLRKSQATAILKWRGHNVSRLAG